jgi:asparagine synthase (glutamine-hydrolysing)
LAALSAYDPSDGTASTIGKSGLVLAGLGNAMACEMGPLLVAADCRLDNRLDLAWTLGVRADLPTAELIAAGWLRWGADLPQHLLGDFAIAVAQPASRTLWLVRDATGQRPLFYCSLAGRLAFASMPSGLEPFGGDLRPDLTELARRLALVEADGRTEFAGVLRVLPGSIVRISASGIASHRWWQPSFEDYAANDDLVEEYRSLLDDSVRVRLPDRAPVAVHLSSGWDSSGIAATASRLTSPQRVTAFTSAPLGDVGGAMIRDRFADESGLAAVTARAGGIGHVIVRDGPSPLLAAWRFTRLSQAVILNPFNASWWSAIRTQASERGARTILTGELGNLSLNAGGLGTLAALVREQGFRSWWSEARSAAASGRVRWRGVMINSFGHALPRWGWSALHRVAQGTHFQDQPFVRPEWRRSGALTQPSGQPKADRLRTIESNEPAAWHLTAEAEGLSELDPFSDRRLLEFSLRLPPVALLANGVDRPLARAALADRVPADVLDHPARGLQSSDWHLRLSAAEARETLEEIGASSLVREFLDMDALDRAIAAWPTGDWNSPRIFDRYRVSLVASLCAGIFIHEYS